MPLFSFSYAFSSILVQFPCSLSLSVVSLAIYHLLWSLLYFALIYGNLCACSCFCVLKPPCPSSFVPWPMSMLAEFYAEVWDMPMHVYVGAKTQRFLNYNSLTNFSRLPSPRCSHLKPWKFMLRADTANRSMS